LVLTIRFTGDPNVHEAAIREIWGGALCLATAPVSEKDLLALQGDALSEIADALGASDILEAVR
jgi:hypothetical protein